MRHSSLLIVASLLALTSCQKPTTATPPSTPAASVAPVREPRVAIDIHSSYIDEKETAVYYAGTALDENSKDIPATASVTQWTAMHAAFKLRAKQMADFNKTKGWPTEKMAIRVYENEPVPDLKELKSAGPSEGIVALYDNTLTGSWRFCFGGLRGSGAAGSARQNDFTKCVFESEPVSADTYDPAK